MLHQTDNLLTVLCDEVGDVFLRLIHGATGDVLALSHAENVFRWHRIAVGQHASNENFGCRRLGFGADAAEQFLRGYLIIPFQPSEPVAVTERERQRFTFRREGRFVVNDDTDVGFTLESAHQKDAPGGSTEVDRAESAIGTVGAAVLVPWILENVTIIS